MAGQWQMAHNRRISDLEDAVKRLTKAIEKLKGNCPVEEDDEEEEPQPVDREHRFVISCTKRCKPGTKCKPSVLYYCGNLLQGKIKTGLWLSDPRDHLFVFKTKEAAVRFGNKLTLPSMNHGELKVLLQQRDLYEGGEETDWETMETAYYFPTEAEDNDE